MLTYPGDIVDCPLRIEAACRSDRETLFLDYHIWTHIDRNCLYVPYDKKRGRQEFENLATCPVFYSHLYIDIKLDVPSSQLLRIARRSKRLRELLYDAAELISRMVRPKYPTICTRQHVAAVARACILRISQAQYHDLLSETMVGL